MRTEEEMYSMLLQIAEEDDRIRVVYMNGSRTNQNVPKDIFQDYDVVYVVTDENYYVKKPTSEQFLCTCNEFWWCLNNVAKGLWREEILYVQDMINFVVRKQLESVLSWKIGIKSDFSVSVGKSAKYMYKWLKQEEYDEYLSTYALGNVEDCWRAVFKMTGLFSTVANNVAEELGYLYNIKEEKACIDFLNVVRDLPKDAKEIVKENYK